MSEKKINLATQNGVSDVFSWKWANVVGHTKIGDMTGKISSLIFDSLDFYKFMDCVGAKLEATVVEKLYDCINDGAIIEITNQEIVIKYKGYEFKGKILHKEAPFGEIVAYIILTRTP